MAQSKSSGKVRVTLSRSFIGRDDIVRSTVRALGLKKIGDSREHNVSPALLGMIRRVQNVLCVENVK